MQLKFLLMSQIGRARLNSDFFVFISSWQILADYYIVEIYH